MQLYAWLVMVDVVVGEQYHINTFSNVANWHYEMHPRILVYAESGLQSSFVGKYGVNKNGMFCIDDFLDSNAYQPNNCFFVHNVMLHIVFGYKVRKDIPMPRCLKNGNICHFDKNGVYLQKAKKQER